MSNVSCAVLTFRAVARPRLAAVLAVLPLAAIAADSSTVVQQDRAFSVAAISISRGQTVHFSNEDTFTHEIYVETPQFTFESDEQEPGENVSVTFPTSGHFVVHCHIHPKMHLDVEVK